MELHNKQHTCLRLMRVAIHIYTYCIYIYFFKTEHVWEEGDLYINIQWSSFLLFGGDEQRNRSRGI